jgi:hypothetical protein
MGGALVLGLVVAVILTASIEVGSNGSMNANKKP